jgi:DUF2933 family protein
MQHDHPLESNDASSADRMRNVSRWVFWGFVAVALYFLITEHRAHIVPFLPFLLFAACPLMHLFHHRGHSHRDEGQEP